MQIAVFSGDTSKPARHAMAASSMRVVAAYRARCVVPTGAANPAIGTRKLHHLLCSTMRPMA